MLPPCVPKHAPLLVRAGGAFPVCPFRSFLQHEPQRAIARTAPHDRQNNSARPSARHIAAQSPVSHTPRHAAPPAAPRKALGPAVMPDAPSPPRHENSPVSRTPHAAPPSPRPSHFRAQSGQPHKNWAAPDRTHRPSPAVKTIRQQRPHPKARAPRPYGRGARFLFVRFVPSSSMSRSAQSQEPRRTIAKTPARYGMGRSAARMVSGEHRKSRSARPQEPPRSHPRRPRRFSPPRPRPRWAPDAARPPRPPRACPRPRASGARPACSAR